MNSFTKICKRLHSSLPNKKFHIRHNSLSPSPTFTIKVGTSEGDPLSSFLCSFHTCQSICQQYQFKNVQISRLLYADDTSFMVDSAENVQIALNSLLNHCNINHFNVKIEKSKILIVPRSKLTQPILFYNNEPLETVEEFKYLSWYYN